MRTMTSCALVLALTLAACGGTTGEPSATGDDGGTAATTELVALCRDLPEVAPDPADLRDRPVYVGNEQPTEEVAAWAASQPGYAGEVWIDRDANGWVVAGFTDGVEDAAAEAAERFADEGVVVVEVSRSLDELLALQATVHERAPIVQGSSSNVRRGVVEAYVPRLTDAAHAEVSSALAGEPVCLDGGDPAEAPGDGPQPTEGDGWRLLAAEQVSTAFAFRTGVLTDGGAVEALLGAAGIDPGGVDVDFEGEVVIWFGEAHGGSCPERRLDDITVEGSLLHAVIVDPTDPMACTSDLAGAWLFVVAVDRGVLPSGPFEVRLSDGRVIDGETTRVDADLSVPGATLDPADVSVPDPDPRASLPRDGDVIEPGFPTEVVMYVHCGVGVLGTYNGVFFVAEDDAVHAGPIPPAWEDLVNDELVVVEVLLEEGDPPTATATANGHSIRYVPGDPQLYGCD